MNKPPKIKYFSKFNNRRAGSALMMSLIILASILVVTLSAANIVVLGVKLSGSQGKSTKAYFAAEAGAERVLWSIRQAASVGSGYNFFTGCDNLLADPDKIPCANFGIDPVICDDCDAVSQQSLSNGSSYKVWYDIHLDASGVQRKYFTSLGDNNELRRAVEVSAPYQN